MGKIIISDNVSLDGVIQAPQTAGGPVRWLHRPAPRHGDGQADPRMKHGRKQSDRTTVGRTRQSTGLQERWAVRAGFAACALGLVFGLISIYWGCGGTLGLNTIGGTIERLARAHNAGIFAAVWITGLAKLAGAVLALALVRPWGARFPRRITVFLAWAVAILLTLYGAVLVAGDALAAAGVIKPSTPIAWTPCSGTCGCGTCLSWSGDCCLA